MRISKTLAACLLLATTLLSGCTAPASDTTAPSQSSPQTTAAYEDGVTTRIATLKGPTTMGLVQLAKDTQTQPHYQVDMYTSADEIVPLIVKGEADIALIPANLASILYGKTQGQISVINLNTLSVLDVLSGDSSIQSIADLKGKTVYATGKGAVPEYALQYVLEKNGLSTSDVTIEFKSEPTEAVSALASNPTAVAVLPQPFATVALTQQGTTIKTVMHLGEQWDNVSDNGSKLISGVTIVRTAFLQEHPSAVAKFLQDHATSVSYVNENPAQAATMIEEYGIVKAAIAEKAIASCNLVSITGEEMKTALSGFLSSLFDMSPDAVGGTLPNEAFYFIQS